MSQFLESRNLSFKEKHLGLKLISLFLALDSHPLNLLFQLLDFSVLFSLNHELMLFLFIYLLIELLCLLFIVITLVGLFSEEGLDFVVFTSDGVLELIDLLLQSLNAPFVVVLELVHFVLVVLLDIELKLF
jgi:hypothetical protein